MALGTPTLCAIFLLRSILEAGGRRWTELSAAYGTLGRSVLGSPDLLRDCVLAFAYGAGQVWIEVVKDWIFGLRGEGCGSLVDFEEVLGSGQRYCILHVVRHPA